MKAAIARALRIASARVERNPSNGQKEAGNYAKGHLKAFGFDITLENPKGSTRSGKDKDGKTWKCTLPAHYGYLKQTVGADRDHLDVYIGDDHASDKVWVIDQVDAKSKAFDEHKALLGFKSKADAVACYEKAFSDGKGKDRIGAIHEMPLEAFRAWAKHGNTTDPLALARKYASGGAVQGYAGGGGISPELDFIIANAASQYGIDPSLMRAFARIESGGNPYARTGSYQGLFQLSNGEFARYGGTGDIYDPTANAQAAAMKLKAEMADFNRKYGRDPTAGELYLIHQQGEGGAAAHWANPDAPAWQNMYSTAEGRQKGPGWAKQAIWGNVPDDLKRQYGSVDNLTSRQFTDLWNQKVSHFGAPSGPPSFQMVADDTPGPNDSSIATGADRNSSIAMAPDMAPDKGLSLAQSYIKPMPSAMSLGREASSDPLASYTPKSYYASPQRDGGADWVEGPLGLMPKWSDNSTPLQGFADGGTPSFEDIVAQNPYGPFGSGLSEMRSTSPGGSRDPDANRPYDPVAQPVAEMISPTLGGYGMGQAAAEAYLAAQDKDWQGALSNLAPLALGMALPLPGVKGMGRVFEKPEVNESGFFSPSLEAAKVLPQEKGTVGQFKSMLLHPKYGGKPKELQALGFDEAFPDVNAKITRGEIEDFLRGNRVGLGETSLSKNGYQLSDAEQQAISDARMANYHKWQRGELDDETYRAEDRRLEQSQWAKAQGDPRYESYSTPGGIPGSYREVVVTLPLKKQGPISWEDYSRDFVRRDGTVDPAVEPTLRRNFEEAQRGGLGGLPDSNEYTSSHWPGITNPLLHYRIKDFPESFVSGNRVEQADPFLPSQPSVPGESGSEIGSPVQAYGSGEGTPASTSGAGGLKQQPGKVRVLDELQSDWAQRARDQGTRDPAAVEGLTKRKSELDAVYSKAKQDSDVAFNDAMKHIGYGDPLFQRLADAAETDPKAAEILQRWQKSSADMAAAHEQLGDVNNKLSAATRGVPSAPFIGNTSDWVDLGLKQVLSEAARDPSISRLAWAPGRVHAERYNMGAVADSLEFEPSAERIGAYGNRIGTLVAKKNGQIVGQFPMQDRAMLDEHIGKELSDRLLSQPMTPMKNGRPAHQLHNLGEVAVGGYGHKGFYGDFDKSGTFFPGIVGTRLLKLVKALDPEAAKIEGTGIQHNEVRANFLNDLDAAIRAQDSTIHPQQARQLTNHIAQILEKEGLPGLDSYDAPRGFEVPWNMAVEEAKRVWTGRTRYPSIPITPKLREALKKGLPLFSLAPAALLPSELGLTPPEHGSDGYPASGPDEGLFADGGSVDDLLKKYYGDEAYASPEGSPFNTYSLLPPPKGKMQGGTRPMPFDAPEPVMPWDRPVDDGFLRNEIKKQWGRWKR